MTLQEWVACGIVAMVAALAIWRWWHRRRESACSRCPVAPGCSTKSDDDVRVLDVARHLPRKR